MSNSAMGKTAWNKGLPMSEEQKVKLSIIRKGATSPRKGVKLTEETKDKIRKANLGGKSPSAKAVYNTETNETFETIRQAAKSINMSCSTLSSMLNGNSFNKTNLKFKK